MSCFGILDSVDVQRAEHPPAEHRAMTGCPPLDPRRGLASVARGLVHIIATRGHSGCAADRLAALLICENAKLGDLVADAAAAIAEHRALSQAALATAATPKHSQPNQRLH